jgi:MFS family permease
MLFTAALLIGVCNAFFDPAVNALTPDLVPADQIEAANALRQSSRQMTVLSAQGLGGILYSLFGPPALFLINGLSFLFAGASELLIKPKSSFCNGAGAPPPAPSTFLGQSAEGFRYVAAQPGMVAFLVTGAVFNALLMPISVLLPVYATQYLQVDVRWYGFLLAAIGAGAIAGCTALGAARSKLTGPNRRALLVTAYAGLGLALMVLGQVRSLWAAFAILFATGAMSGTVNVLVMSIIQRRTSGEFRGRVIGLQTMMTRVLVPIGLVGGGAIADYTGRNVPLVYAICGALAMASVIVLTTRQSARDFLASS